MKNKHIPLVSIHCITYNHKDFIVEAIESFLMQKTNFSFEIVIGEDCSTDGTREIVFDYAEKYPERIRPITSDKNVGMVENAQRTLLAVKGKYITFCEGDDYWTDPLKLQTQFDFLEANPEYGLVHTDNSNLYHSTGRLISSHKADYYPNPPSGNVFEILMRKNFVSTSTVFARTNLVLAAKRNLYESMDNDLLIDYSLWLEIAKHSKLKYIDDITAVYRISDGTASRPTSKKGKDAWSDTPARIQDFFIKYYKIDNNLREEIYNQRFLEKLRTQYRKNSFKKRLDKSVDNIVAINSKDRLLLLLYKLKSPRNMYVLLEFPSFFIRKTKRVFQV